MALSSRAGMSAPLMAAGAKTSNSRRAVACDSTKRGRRLRSTPWRATTRMDARRLAVPRMKKFVSRRTIRIESAACIRRSPQDEHDGKGGHEGRRDEKLRHAHEAQAGHAALDDADGDADD